MPEDLDKVRAGLTDPSITSHGVEVTARTVTPLYPGQKKVPTFAYLITLTGVDRPGDRLGVDRTRLWACPPLDPPLRPPLGPPLDTTCALTSPI